MDRVELLERALLSIEGLTYLSSDEDKLMGDIYRVAHEALGFCKGCGSGNISNLLDEIKNDLKTMGIMDVDKAMREKSMQMNETNGIPLDKGDLIEIAGNIYRVITGNEWVVEPRLNNGIGFWGSVQVHTGEYFFTHKGGIKKLTHN